MSKQATGISFDKLIDYIKAQVNTVQAAVDEESGARVGLAEQVEGFSVKTADYTLTEDDYTVLANSSSALTFTLPASSGEGKKLTIHNTGAGRLTVAADGSDEINGRANIELTRYESASLIDWQAGDWFTDYQKIDYTKSMLNMGG